MFRDYSLNRMLVLCVTVGFAFLLLETTLEHRDILSRELAAFIPVVVCAIAVVLGAVAVIRWKEPALKLMQIVLLVSIAVGLLGIYFHVREEEDKDAKPTVARQENQENEREKEKSPVAPLAFVGLAAIGLLGTAKRWRTEVGGGEDNRVA